MGPTEVGDIRAVERRAVARARLSDAGIGAVVAQRLGTNSRGEEQLRVRISDGEHFGWLVVTLTEPVSADVIEAAVERESAKLPVADRLDALEALSPLAHNA